MLPIPCENNHPTFLYFLYFSFFFVFFSSFSLSWLSSSTKCWYGDLSGCSKVKRGSLGLSAGWSRLCSGEPLSTCRLYLTSVSSKSPSRGTQRDFGFMVFTGAWCWCTLIKLSGLLRTSSRAALQCLCVFGWTPALIESITSGGKV